LANWYWQRQRLFWHDDPSGEVSDHAQKPKYRAYNPDYPYQRNVKIKILGKAFTDTGDLAAFASAHQAFGCQRPRCSAQALAAISTKLCVIWNLFASRGAIHISSIRSCPAALFAFLLIILYASGEAKVYCPL